MHPLCIYYLAEVDRQSYSETHRPHFQPVGRQSETRGRYQQYEHSWFIKQGVCHLSCCLSIPLAAKYKVGLEDDRVFVGGVDDSNDIYVMRQIWVAVDRGAMPKLYLTLARIDLN